MNQIESYNISKSQYGVITLIINTKDKSVLFDDCIVSEGFQIDVWKDPSRWTIIDSLLVHDHEFGFELEKEGFYHRLHLQEKDQIVYYFIPIRLLKSDEWVEKFIQSKNKVK